MVDSKKIILALLLAASPLTAAFDFAPPQGVYPEHLMIQNRVLLKINGKPISVMDVVKKMDLLFYRQYPELAASPIARYQFYSAGWRNILGSVVDDQLIMADAAEKKIEVTDGEVREELEGLFGPDVVLNLDKMGMTLDEAFELLKTELIVQRMLSIMVRSKAISEVYPKNIRSRYANLLKENPPKDHWVYQTISLRGQDHEKIGKQVSERIDQKSSLEEIALFLQSEGAEFTISEEYKRDAAEISLAHMAILSHLSVGAYSAPETKNEVTRIFFLKEIEKGQDLAFRDVEIQLKKEMTEEAYLRNNQAYRDKLRKNYGLSDKVLNKEIPETLQPFALK